MYLFELILKIGSMQLRGHSQIKWPANGGRRDCQVSILLYKPYVTLFYVDENKTSSLNSNTESTIMPKWIKASASTFLETQYQLISQVRYYMCLLTVALKSDTLKKKESSKIEDFLKITRPLLLRRCTDANTKSQAFRQLI